MTQPTPRIIDTTRAPLDMPIDVPTRRAQILAAAENALTQRVRRRQTLLTVSGCTAVSAALLLAWFISPFTSPGISTSTPPGPIVRIDPPAPSDLASLPTPAWISNATVRGDWLADSGTHRHWLIGSGPEPDWLSHSPAAMTLATDDDLDDLAAQLTDHTERGTIRVNGRSMLARDLPAQDQAPQDQTAPDQTTPDQAQPQ